MRYALLMAILSCGFYLGCSPVNVLEPIEYDEELVGSAIVRTPSPIFRDGKDLIRIVKVDGEAITFFENKVVVHPGRHVFQIQLELKNPKGEQTLITRADTTLSFTTQAAHEYLIDAVDDSQGLWVWATDLTDNAIVAGSPPSSSSISAETSEN